MTRGKLIVFSGLDGAGKSTQIEFLKERLIVEGQHPVYLWIRGGYTPIFNVLKSFLRRLSGKKALPPAGHSKQREQILANPRVRNLWLFVAMVDLLWLLGVQIRWLRWRGRIVICDRYLWDTLVDFRLNYPNDNIENGLMWRLLAGMTPKPNAAFLLLVPVDESVRRSDIKGEPYRDPPEVLAQRLAQYQALSSNGRWQVLDGRDPVSKLADKVWIGVSGARGI